MLLASNHNLPAKSHNMTYQYNHRYAPPITREEFSCSGPSDEDFYITLPSDPTSRYSRADPSYLYFLLTYTEPLRPILSNSSSGSGSGSVAKIQPPVHKDKSQGFYCAQLMHYGRKVLKTKGAAKKELLAAFWEEGGLRVPESIVRLRREMREEYVRVNERALEEKAEAERKGKGKGRVAAKRKLVAADDVEGDDEAATRAMTPPKRRKQTVVKASTTGTVASSQTKGAGSVGATSSNKVRTVSYSSAICQSTPYTLPQAAPTPRHPRPLRNHLSLPLHQHQLRRSTALPPNLQFPGNKPPHLDLVHLRLYLWNNAFYRLISSLRHKSRRSQHFNINIHLAGHIHPPRQFPTALLRNRPHRASYFPRFT